IRFFIFVFIDVISMILFNSSEFLHSPPFTIHTTSFIIHNKWNLQILIVVNGKGGASMDDEYIQLMQEKKKFIIIALSFMFIFYFMLPVALTFFPGVMNLISFISGVTWPWLYAFSQIVMIWILGLLYHRKAKKIDRVLEQM